MSNITVCVLRQRADAVRVETTVEVGSLDKRSDDDFVQRTGQSRHREGCDVVARPEVSYDTVKQRPAVKMISQGLLYLQRRGGIGQAYWR